MAVPGEHQPSPKEELAVLNQTQLAVFDIPLSHHSCCSLAGPREWVCFGGYPVPPTAEAQHGWLVEFQPWNGFKTQHK